MSWEDILHHQLVEWSKSLTIYGSHCTLDQNNNYPNCWRPTIYPASCRFDHIPPCTRTTFWRASCRGFSPSPWSDWDDIEGTLFIMSVWSYCLSYVQTSWVTIDNASNNDTFMLKLDEELKACNIPFDKVGHRIRFMKQQDLVDPDSKLTIVKMFSPYCQFGLQGHFGCHFFTQLWSYAPRQRWQWRSDFLGQADWEFNWVLSKPHLCYEYFFRSSYHHTFKSI